MAVNSRFTGDGSLRALRCRSFFHSGAVFVGFEIVTRVSWLGSVEAAPQVGVRPAVHA